MTPEALRALLGEQTNSTLHPAWSAFCRMMRDKQYGRVAASSAWHFFREGWDTHRAQSRG